MSTYREELRARLAVMTAEKTRIKLEEYGIKLDETESGPDETLRAESPNLFVAQEDKDADFSELGEPKPFSIASLRSAKKRKNDGEDASKSNKRPFAPPQKIQHNTSQRISKETIDTRALYQSADWYASVPAGAKYSRQELQTLRFIFTLLKNAQNAGADSPEFAGIVSQIRTQVYRIGLYEFVSKVLIKKSKLLEPGGLSAIFSKDESSSAKFPWDVRADAQELYQKWTTGAIDPHLLRGIELKQGKSKKNTTVSSYNLEKDYVDKISCNYIGQGTLANGQWFPLQICAMRDGAHGEIEGGIHGQPGKGAYSAVMSGGGYSDIDNGDKVEYCGTSSADTTPTAYTKHMLKSYELQQPLRVLRSAKLDANNKYRPAKGLRYDGLYKIDGFEILDVGTAMHRFNLSRVEGQDPIRYEGVEKRPSEEELGAYAKIRELLGKT